jgi:hypothetical protein
MAMHTTPQGMRPVRFDADIEDVRRFKMLCVRQDLAMADVLRVLIARYVAKHERGIVAHLEAPEGKRSTGRQAVLSGSQD